MKTYLLDLDGTMYHGNTCILEAKLFVEDITNSEEDEDEE